MFILPAFLVYFFTLGFRIYHRPTHILHNTRSKSIFSFLLWVYTSCLNLGASVEYEGEVFEKVRSATACSQETATNLSAPHLSVFLTVNSLAKLVSRHDPFTAI